MPGGGGSAIGATHTGTRETDILLGDFVARLGDGLTPEEVAAAERLLAANDVDILNWIAGGAAVPARFDTPPSWAGSGAMS